MNVNTKDWGPATTLIVILVVIGALAGAVISIVNPDILSFDQLLNDLTKFVIGLGALGIGRGIMKAGKVSR